MGWGALGERPRARSSRAVGNGSLALASGTCILGPEYSLSTSRNPWPKELEGSGGERGVGARWADGESGACSSGGSRLDGARGGGLCGVGDGGDGTSSVGVAAGGAAVDGGRAVDGHAAAASRTCQGTRAR